MSSRPGSDLIKVLSPAIIIFELWPRTLYLTNVLIAKVSCYPNVDAAVGRSAGLAANEKPLPKRSRNITFAVLVKEFGLADRVKSLLRFKGPMPAKL
jgi:hypothetical protein